MKLIKMIKDLIKYIIKNKAIPFWFIRDYFKYLTQGKKNKEHSFLFKWYPIFSNKNDTAGSMDLHYFFQDLLVAQKIFLNAPENHLDIGSKIDGFVAHIASFRKIDVMDIRPLPWKMDNISFLQADLMDETIVPSKTYDSVSSLSVLEHFGLGRYGDEVDYLGHIKGLNNIKKYISPNGKFYLSVPVGKQAVEFNAHRIFSTKYLWNILKDDFRLDAFHYVDTELHTNVNFEEFDSDKFTFICGIFELTKK